MLGSVPAAMVTSCQDYGDDIDALNQRDDTLQKEIDDKLSQQSDALKTQVAALEKELSQLKSDAANANAAAEAAANAAAEAKNAAADALADAAAAQAAGDAAGAAAADAAAAAADANAAAQAANAEAMAAQAAAATAKAEAVEEAKKQVENLSAQIESQINALKQEYGEQYDAVAKAVAEAATKQELNEAVATLEASIASSKLTKAEIEEMLADYINQINGNSSLIAALSGKIDGIDTSVNTLSTDLGNVKNDLSALTQNVGKNTTDIAANAASIAAETERIDAIVKTTIPGLETKIEDVDAALQTQISAYNTFVTQTNTQLAALETFKNTYETLLSGLADELQGLHGDVTELNDKITAAEEALATAQADILKNATAISDLQGNVTEVTDKIETITGTITGIQTDVKTNKDAIEDIKTTLTTVQNDIRQINSALSTLAATNAKRLTSLTLVPSAYVGGIPTIEFYSASFKPMGTLNATTGIYAAPAANADPVIVTNNDTQVYYRMNPAGVSIDDIDAANVAFVQQIATSRAADDPVVKVVSVKKDNATGYLVVTATKNDGVTGSIDNANAVKPNSIYTVALQVPIAEKNYYKWTDAEGNTVTEDAADAVVYSEFSRLAESTFTPEIAHVDDKGALVDHFATSDIWTANPAATPVAEVPFTYEEGEYFDLKALVAGCMNDGTNHKVMTPEELESFGFTFEYSVPAQAYTVDGVNQQLYATVTADGQLTPKNPTNAGTASRIGKTPIISVVMKYNNQVVDQKFFTIEYTSELDGKDFEIDVFTKTLQCEEFEATVTWDYFVKNVINELPFDMTPAEFVENYTVTDPDGVTSSFDAVPTDLSTAIFTWTVAPSDFANMAAKNVDLEKEVTFTSTSFPSITVTLNGTVEWPTALPTLGTTDDAFWSSNGVMKIQPTEMPKNYDGSTTAEYNTNVLSGRNLPYLNNLLDCANWDIQIAGVSDSQFAAGATAPSEEEGAYQVVKGTEVAATIWSGDDDHEAFGLDAADAKVTTDLIFNISENPAGIALVEAEATVNLGWYIYLNGKENGNDYAITSGTSLQVIKPLKSLNTGAIEALTQNSVEQTRDLAEGMTITDCYNNVFTEYKVEDGQVTTDKTDFAQWYDIKSVVFGGELTITDEDGTNERTPASLNWEVNVTEDGTLTFSSHGIALQKSLVLNIPVVVTHKWGELKSVVKVTINPGL